jgi:hypothetical protein
MLYLNCLDGVSHWTTLITWVYTLLIANRMVNRYLLIYFVCVRAFKILLQTEEDRLIVLVNQGLLTLSDVSTYVYYNTQYHTTPQHAHGYIIHYIHYATLHTTTLHYTTPHYTTLQYNTLLR